MHTVNLTQLKKHGTKALATDQPTHFLVNSELQFVVLPADHYQQMVDSLEDYEDLLIAKARLNGKKVNVDEFFGQLEEAQDGAID